MKTSTKALLVPLLLLLLLAGTQAPAQSVPEYVNYQGLLKAADGSPLATGNYTIEFNIYDQANGGTKVWGPFLFDGSIGNGHGPLVPVINGGFNVIIGPTDTGGVSVANAFSGANRFIEIKVNGGAPILPRQQFLSTAYALQSQKAQLANVASTLVKELSDALCPPGAIVAFGGTNIASGWLRCDGRPLTNALFPNLFAAIGTNWGNGTFDSNGNAENPPNPATGFNLPDLRGMFLRGVNANLTNAAWVDPDAAARPSRYGGNAGNAVGSVQDDALQNVAGTIGDFNDFGAFKGTPTGPFAREDNVYRSTGIPAGAANDNYDRITMDLSRVARTSTETRPNNAYVNYIIKY